MNKNLKKATAIVPATLLLAMAMPTSASAVTQHAGLREWHGRLVRRGCETP